MSGFFFCGSIDEPVAVGVVEPGEAELVARPQHPLLADPRRGATPTSVRSNSASATKSRSLTASRRVVEASGEAEVGGRRRRVDRQRRAGERAGAERRHVEPVDRVEQAIDVAGQRPAVGEEVVGEQHRLGPLEVGVAGQVRSSPAASARASEHVLQGDDRAGRRSSELALAPQAEVGRDLVVAAAAGVQLGARPRRRAR